MVTQITAGATGALGNITMVDADGGKFDSSDLSGMISNITSGATGALGDISMEGYSSDNISAMTTSISTSVTNSVSNITMLNTDGTTYDPSTDNFTSSITSGASSAGLIFIGSDNVSGTYSTTWYGAVPSNGCVSNGTALATWSSYMPSGTVGFKHQKIFTSANSFTKKYSYYADSSCSTSTGYIKFSYTNISVNPAAITTTTSTSGFPGSAYQVQYSRLNTIAKGETSTVVSYLNNRSDLGGGTYTVNVEKTNQISGLIYNIWATAIVNTTLDNGTAVGIPWLYYGSEKTPPDTYPTTYQRYDDMSYKHP
jgi:hypothetical protein